jgi:hypothetical protein
MGAAVTFEEITLVESWRIFNDASKRLLDIPGEELIRRWDAGEMRDERSPELMRVLMLRPRGG